MTSSQLRIGKVGRRAFALPPDIATQASAIHGVRGKGKTVTAAVIVEELLALGIQVVVIDPTDVWWGLKSSADGKAPGHDIVILGGAHADLPLLSTSGSVIADFVVDRGASLILSLRHLRKGEQRRLVTEFAEQLFHRKGEIENRTPLFLAIDEASQFVPQRVQGDSARMVGAIQDIVRLGRSAGLGCALIDQRPATVNKDVLTQIELLVCHGVTSPQDQKALREWIAQKDSAGRESEFLEDLASLPRGEAWFWHPIADVFERVQVRMRETFDSSKTPELGESAVAPEASAEVDLDGLRAALEATIAEAEANDPKALKKRIAELKAELRDGEPDLDERVREAQREWRAHVDEWTIELVEAVDGLTEAVLEHRDRVVRAVADVRRIVESGADAPISREVARPAGQRDQRPTSAPPTPRRRARRQVISRDTTNGLSGPQGRILGAVAWLEAIGISPGKQTAVAFLADYKPNGGAFNNPKGQLRGMGLIDYPRPGEIALTDAGRAIAEAPDVPPTLAGFHTMVMAKLPGPEQRILQPLLEAYPDDMSAEELAEAAGYSQGGGAFNNPRGRLRTLGLIDYPQSGRVVALDVLFPRGLR